MRIAQEPGSLCPSAASRGVGGTADQGEQPSEVRKGGRVSQQPIVPMKRGKRGPGDLVEGRGPERGETAGSRNHWRER